ncbi:MAG TPA: 50S ribosomal protein L23 [Patescibacteria group bacterium]
MTQINPESIFIRPLITEKTLVSQGTGKYTFLVAKTATKNQIAVAFKKAFGVDALKVNTITMKGDTKQNWKTRKSIVKADTKKVLITVKKDTKLPVLTLKTEAK